MINEKYATSNDNNKILIKVLNSLKWTTRNKSSVKLQDVRFNVNCSVRDSMLYLDNLTICLQDNILTSQTLIQCKILIAKAVLIEVVYLSLHKVIVTLF